MRPTATTSALTATAAVLGSLGTTPDSAWYLALEKPSWQPPPIAFPLVWTPLYASIAYGTGRMIEKAEPQDRGRLFALTAANLTANAAWNWTFFKGRSPAGGLAVLAVLNGLNVALVREASRRDATAGAVLTPYAAWCGFATALNLAIWRRNR